MALGVLPVTDVRYTTIIVPTNYEGRDNRSSRLSPNTQVLLVGEGENHPYLVGF